MTGVHRPWRHHLASRLLQAAALLDPEIPARRKRAEQASEGYVKELKAAWRALDEKTEEIDRLRRLVNAFAKPERGA